MRRTSTGSHTTAARISSRLQRATPCCLRDGESGAVYVQVFQGYRAGHSMVQTSQPTNTMGRRTGIDRAGQSRSESRTEQTSQHLVNRASLGRSRKDWGFRRGSRFLYRESLDCAANDTHTHTHTHKPRSTSIVSSPQNHSNFPLFLFIAAASSPGPRCIPVIHQNRQSRTYYQHRSQ